MLFTHLPHIILDVRIAALEALVDFTRVDGKWEDMEFLLDMIEADPHPGVRHRLVRLMVENPPFERAHKHRLDRCELVDRIWNLAKYVDQLFRNSISSVRVLNIFVVSAVCCPMIRKFAAI